MTLNEYHDIEPWELMQENGPEIILVDVSDYMNSRKLEENHALLTSLRIEYDILINHAVKCLEKARDIHMCVENLYIPNMNFSEIASALGFNSLHYFSRAFKKITGISPSVYKNSIIK